MKNRITPGAAILLYHRVTDLPTDPQMLAVTPEHFEEHISILRNRYNVISLSDFNDALKQQKIERNTVVITFDDGYYDNHKYAKPILESHQIPATFFVATANLDTQNEFWWDDLERIILTTTHLPDTLDLNINNQSHNWTTGQYAKLDNFSVLDDGPLHPRQQIYKDLCALLRPLPHDSQRKILNQLSSWANVDTRGRDSHRAMTTEELRSLNQSKFADIGCHTHNHCELSALTAQQQNIEINTNKQQLELLLSKPINTFSYPYGSRSAYNADSVQAAKDIGFDLACSNFPGIARKDANPFELPRVLVRDLSAKAFSSNMRRWLCD